MRLSFAMEDVLGLCGVSDFELLRRHDLHAVACSEQRDHSLRVGGEEDEHVLFAEAISLHVPLHLCEEERDVAHPQELSVSRAVELAPHAHLHSDHRSREQLRHVRVHESTHRRAGIQEQLVEQVADVAEMRLLLVPEMLPFEGRSVVAVEEEVRSDVCEAVDQQRWLSGQAVEVVSAESTTLGECGVEEEGLHR